MDKNTERSDFGSDQRAFRIIAEASVNATSSLDLCNRTLSGLVEVLGFDFGTVRLLNPESGFLELIAIVGMTEDQQQKLVSARVDDPKPVFSLVARTRKPIFASDIVTFNLDQSYKDRLNEINVRALILWPILDVKKNLLGIISLAAHRPVDLHESDESFFELVEEMFSVALQRKLAEEELITNEAKYRALFEQNNDAVFILNLEGRNLEVNNRACDLFGYSREEFLGMSFRDTVIESERADSADRLQRLLGGETLPTYERIVRRKSGEEIIIEVNVALIRDDEGNPLHLQSIMRDVTTWKRSMHDLQKLSMAVMYNPTTVVITDTEGSIEYANPKFSELTGYSIEEAIGKNPSILKSGKTPPETYEELWATITSGRVWHGEFANKKKNGDIYYEEAWIAPILDSGGKITNYVAVKEDITDRVRVENALRRSSNDLELYASILRHDFANDLQIILSQTEIARTAYSPGSTELEWCQVINSTAERMAELLHILGSPDMRDYAEIQDRLEQTAAQAEAAHPGLDIAIMVDTRARRLKIVGGRLLNALFANLFRNAAQHAGPNPQVDITLKREGDQAIIDFVDSGPGIPSEIREKLFEKNTSTGGRGIGLYLCKRIAEGYGGTIECVDPPSSHTGAAFRLRLAIA